MNLSWIVDDCLARLASGESIEACLARYPEQARELASLLGAAVQLRGLAEARLTQGQRLAAKVALREALAEQRRPRTPAVWQWTRAFPFAIVLTVVLFVSLTSAAVAGSQPGDLAYPVRLVVERAPILVQFSTAGRAAEEVDIAGRRLSDIRDYLVQGGAVHPAALKELLARDEAAVRRAANLGPEDRQAILDAVAAHADQLTSLMGLTGDGEAQARLAAAADQIMDSSQRLVTDTKPGPEPGYDSPGIAMTPSATATQTRTATVTASPTKTLTATRTPGIAPQATRTPRPSRTRIVQPPVVGTRLPRPTIVMPSITVVVPQITPPRITPPNVPTVTVVAPRPTRERLTPGPKPTVEVPTVVVPTAVHTPVIPTRVRPTIVIPTVHIPTVVIPTVVIPTVTVPTIEIPTVVLPTRIATRPAHATVQPTVTPGVSDAPTATPTRRVPGRTPVPSVVVPTAVVPTVVVPTVVVPTVVMPATVTAPPPVQTLIVMTVVPPPAVQTLIVMTVVPPPPVQTLIVMTLAPPAATEVAPTVVAPEITRTPGAIQTAVATFRPDETPTPRPRERP